MPKLGRRSERAEYPFMKPGYQTTQYAPFGNDYSITFEEKIVGGNLRKVVKRQPNEFGEKSPRNFPRLETFQPLTDKPNEINPAVIRYYHTANQVQDYSVTQTNGKPTLLASKRPDSKDLAHRYSVLQPIEQNRYKNKTSTVFEPEPGTMQQQFRTNQVLVDKNRDNNIRNSYDAGQYYPSNASPRNVPLWSGNGAGTQRSDETLNRRVDDDYKYNAHDSYSPQQPISFTPEEEVKILQQIGSELRGVDMEQLKQAYLIMTEYDKPLAGWCHYKHMEYALTSSKIILSPDLLRIAASQFISEREPQQVNYEKLLSFIGTAIKQTSEESWPSALYSPRDYHSRPQYFQNDGQPGLFVPKNTKPSTPAYSDQETAKLLSLTEQQLRDSTEPIDFEKLIASFQQADRDLRETLSAEQIKEVCRQNRLPLQDSLLNQILNRCEDIRRDGSRPPRLQYHWIKFVQFLERVQPVHTGLPLPDSKKPLDYAKQYRSPVPNWPKAADSGVPDTPLWRKEDSPRSGRFYNNPPQQYEEPQKSQREAIEKLDHNLHNLELEYEGMRRSVQQGNISHRENETEWFPKFMHLANALYDLDRGRTGSLPTSKVWDCTTLHNEGYDLKIPEHIVAKVIGETSHGGRVDIHRYLTKLGNRDWL